MPGEQETQNNNLVVHCTRQRSFVMATDAKIGLLLGLVLIFIIAFVINGLPRLGRATDGDAPITPAVDNTSVIGARERGFLERPTEPIKGQKEYHSARQVNNDAGVHAAQPAPGQATSEQPTVPKSDPVSSILAKVRYYTVAEGDNLADVAKKFYGALEGNRKVNVLRLFQANRHLLRSPHEIIVGQKLVIPPLGVSDADINAIGSIFPSSMFEKAESIGRRHLSADNSNAEQTRQYVVREGDSLWLVASEQLGDGGRYKEISRLNRNLLEDEDSLTIGMRLNMPAR
jgi:nucleoid-associated protein YgaU